MSGLLVAVANQKGGVGKTTVVLLLAAAAARAGARVLVVDVDPQTNATDTIALEDFNPQRDPTLYDAFQDGGGGAAQKAITASSWAGVNLIPGDVQLARYDSHRDRGAEQRLRRALRGITGYDLVLVDCPRALGPLTDAALVAATDLLVVTEPSRDSLTGVRLVLDTAEAIREDYNPQLHTLGVVLNKAGRYREDKERAVELTDALGELVWSPAMPLRAAINRMRETGRTLYEDTADPHATSVAAIADDYARRLHRQPPESGHRS